MLIGNPRNRNTYDPHDLAGMLNDAYQYSISHFFVELTDSIVAGKSEDDAITVFKTKFDTATRIAEKTLTAILADPIPPKTTKK